jgi:uncharacterized membrane protein YsdA (DUF1294 family)
MVAAEPPSVRKARAGRPFLESAALPAWTSAAACLLVISWLILSRSPLWTGALAWVGVLSVVTFLVFGLDKWKARRDRRRVSETNLLILSALGGALGGLGGMWAWHHKGRRMSFRVILPLALFLHAVVVISLAVHA